MLEYIYINDARSHERETCYNFAWFSSMSVLQSKCEIVPHKI